MSGNLKAIGSQQKLKSEFSNSSEVMLQFDIEKYNVYETKIFLRKAFKPICEIELLPHGMVSFKPGSRIVIVRFRTYLAASRFKLNFIIFLQNTIRCSCPKSVKMSSLFSVLETLKSEEKITGFTVNQATLEQIFMQLTRTV